MQACDTVWMGAHVATMAGGGPYGAIADGALAVRGERVAWVGPASDLPEWAMKGADLRPAGGCWITPGLIDCHTHLVYAGNRSEEFELRLAGTRYADIARAGGGILSTVRATRAATERSLAEGARRRFASFAAEGVTTVEIKSGYGLDVDTEARMLRAARALASDAVEVSTTYLGAHALPPEFAGRPDDYVDLVCEEALPAVAGLADAADAFCEGIGFDRAQVARVFAAAARHDLPVKLHADQLSDLGGGALAAAHGALSADHLEYASEDSVRAMAGAGTVAVLLPGAFYVLRESRPPPVDAFRTHGVPMAVATDANPGSSPLGSLLLALNMACTLFGLTPAEALAGATVNAARALGRAGRIGTLAAGMQADFVLWEIERPAELCYGIGRNPCRAVVKRGRLVHERA